MSNVIRCALPGYNALTDTNLDHYSLYGDVDNVLIKRPMSLRGISSDAAIIQTNPHKNGLYIRDVKSGVSISNLCINGSVAQVALVVANASNIAISSVSVIGSPVDPATFV